jgi:D-glycero-D-manno-heptose 1,7-bisphosphate phosphatase
MDKASLFLPTVFLDRDGTLIHEVKYLKDPQKVKLLPGVARGLRRLKKAGFTVVVTSNQSGLARGLITPAQLEAVRARFLKLLTRHQARLDGYYWCPHGPHARCTCRKPKSGMLRQAGRELHVPWRAGISIGDKASDVQLAQNAGGWGILVLSGFGRETRKNWESVRKPDVIAKNFTAAVEWIVSHVRKDGLWKI